MHKLYELKEKLMQELEDYSENGKFSKEDVEAIKYLTSAVDHLCNIMEEGDEYSMEGSYQRGGNRGGGRSRRGSYEGGSMRGSYEGGSMRGSYQRRDNRGRYSRADITEQLEDIMDEAPNEQVRMEIQRMISKVEKMM